MYLVQKLPELKLLSLAELAIFIFLANFFQHASRCFFEGAISLKEYYNKHNVGVSDFLYLLYLGFCTTKNEIKMEQFWIFPLFVFLGVFSLITIITVSHLDI